MCNIFCLKQKTAYSMRISDRSSDVCSSDLNASLRSMVRTYIKNVVKAIDAKDLDKARTAYTAAVPVIDRMADKGIIHKNKAARHKSRLNGHIRSDERRAGKECVSTGRSRWWPLN